MAVFLAWKCPDFRDIPGWEREQFQKIPVWEQIIFKYSGIFRVGVGEFLGKLRFGNRYTTQIFKNPWRTPAYSKSLFSPQKEIVFRARISLITDIRAGARNSPFNFVSV
jgi:hypothetical protein